MKFNLDKIPASVLVATAAVTGSIASVGGLLAFIGIDPVSLSNAVDQIGKGVVQIVTGVSTIAVIVGTAVAALKDNPLVKLATGSLFAKNNPEAVAANKKAAQAVVTGATAVITANPVQASVQLERNEKAALSQAAVAMAANSESAKNALLDAATTLPSVNAILTDSDTARATKSDLVRAGA